MILSQEWLQRYGWPLSLPTGRPLTIAHRGASFHAPENSLAAFRIASELASELWELDIHLSTDGVCVVAHDDDLQRMTGQSLRISESSWSDISKLKMSDGEPVPRLEDVIATARQTGCGLYLEIKSAGAGPAAWRLLDEAGFRFASLGSFNVTWIEELRQAGCPYPLSVFVPAGADPLEYVGDLSCEIVHLCWENASPRPQDLITQELLSALQHKHWQIVLWHEERPKVLDALMVLPVMAICSDRPELLKPYWQSVDCPIGVVCHRGANALAPENTLEAAQICIDQGFQFVEIDVRTTADGEVVVLHDATLDRTTNGTGLVRHQTASFIASLEAGRWFGDRYKQVRVPTLSQVLVLAAGRIGVYVEIKQASAEAVLNRVEAHGMLNQCFFWSSDTDALRWMRQKSPDIILMAPRWMYASIEEAIADYGAQIVEFDVTEDDLDEVPLCKNLGVRSMIYSQSHDPSDLSHYMGYQPDLLNLDAPNRFKILARYPDVEAHFKRMS